MMEWIASIIAIIGFAGLTNALATIFCRERDRHDEKVRKQNGGK